jgi:ribosomal-protein-alanine N-acetyltransferase
MIKIRKARDEDIIKVADLEKQCFSRPWSYQSFIFELESRDAWFTVAEDDGRVVGFAILHRFVDEGELFNIAVAEDVRRQKIGERLLRDIFVGAKKYGIKKIFLEVRKSNDPARALYTKYGFEVCGLRKNYYDDPKEDAILMEAEVSDTRLGEEI